MLKKLALGVCICMLFRDLLDARLKAPANGVPAIFTPLAQSLASASGLPLMAVLMIQVIGFSTPLLPYQASPIVVAMAMGRVPQRAALRLCLALAAIT